MTNNKNKVSSIEKKEDHMDEFYKTKNLAKKFMCFIQSLDKWVYGMENTNPIALEDVDDLAVKFAKEVHKNK